MFRAYFTEGLNIGERSVIAGISETSGLDAEELKKALDEGRFLPRLKAAREEGEAIGLTGVPTFIANGNTKSSGHKTPMFSATCSRKSSLKIPSESRSVGKITFFYCGFYLPFRNI